MTDWQDALNQARLDISVALVDGLDLYRLPQAGPEIGIQPASVGLTDGFGGTVGVGNTTTPTSTGNLRTKVLSQMPCRLEPMPLRTESTSEGSRVAEKTRWSLSIPWNMDIRISDTAVVTLHDTGEQHTLIVMDYLIRSEALVRKMLVEEHI